MKKNLGKKNWMFPMPVLMIGTYGEDGTPDVMNAAWGGITLEDEITICIDTSHKTWANIAARKAFTVVFGTADTVASCDYLGLVSGNKVPVDGDTYTKVSTDGGSSYLTLYSAQGGSTREDILTYGNTGRAGFSSEVLFPSFLFEVYDGDDQKIGWTTLAYADAANYIYSDPSNNSGVSVYKVTQLIPEPTSGLLFLLGAAGLALRRRKMALA